MAAPTILYDNLYLLGTPVATDTAAGYNVLNVTDYKDYTFWQANGTGTKRITIDCGTSKTANCLGIYAHNLDSSGANATVSVESSVNGTDWTSRLAGFTPQKGANVKKVTSVSARYWRVNFVTASIAPRVGVLFLGARLDMEQPAETPIGYMNESVTAKAEESTNGNYLGAIVQNHPINQTAMFKGITKTWFDTNFLPFVNTHYKKLKPFFYAHDLDTYSADCFYVHATPEMVFDPQRWRTGEIETFSLSFRGQTNEQ
jgi:hypothetical protein